MKKTISILLIVTMLLSMLVVSIPAAAEEAQSNTADTVFVPTWTGEHKTEQQLESETGKDFTVIASYDDFNAITSGTADAVKYYCVILPAGTETLVMSGNTHLDGKYLENIYFDFNGYSVDVSGINNALFNTLTKATVKNLKIVGDLYIRSAKWTGAGYDYKCEENGLSPLMTGNTKTGVADSVITLDNVVSSVNMVVSQQHGSGKYFGGIASQLAGGSVVKNCVFDGSITVETDSANSKVSKAQVGRLGGIAARANNTTFENCLSAGTITFDDNIFFGTESNGYGNVGGLVGYSQGTTSYTKCENRANITVNAEARKTVDAADVTVITANIGGITGTATGSTSIKNCINAGDVTVTAGQNLVGGIVGNIDSAKVVIENNVNKGDITWTTGGATGGTFGVYDLGMGGIVGVLNAAVTLKNCHNEGNVLLTKGSVVGTGVFGAGGVVGAIVVPSVVTDCTNAGTVTYNIKRTSEAEAVGGIVGKVQTKSTDVTTIKNCENKAGATVTGIEKESYVANGDEIKTGGILGYAKYAAVTIDNCNNKATLKASFYSGGGLGGIIGEIQQNTGYYDCKVTIKNCENSGLLTISLDTNLCRTTIGGILGNTYAPGPIEITNCVNRGEISGDNANRNSAGDKNNWSACGGIVGSFDYLQPDSVITVSYCVNYANVTSSFGVGGVVGGLYRSNGAKVTILDCDNYGTVKNIANNSKYSGVGGVLGLVNDTNRGTITVDITDCMNRGLVKANFNYVGGIVGGSQYNTKTSDNSALSGSNAGDIIRITNCVNAGAVNNSGGTTSTHPRHSGGIVANATVGQYFITDCVNLGTVSGGKDAQRGAIAGGTNVTIVNSFYLEGVFSGADVNNSADLAISYEEALIAVEETNTLVDKKAFREIIEAITGENFPGEAKYTAASLAPLYAAVEKALPINNTPIFTINNGVIDFDNVDGLQAQINAAYAEIVAAQKNLKITVTASNTIKEAIAAAEELYNDESVYTAASWKKFIDAINVAKLVIEDPTNLISPEDAVADLQAAIDALVLGGDIYSDSDFAMLEGQYGVFELHADITVNAALESFHGVLNGNGYTITLNGCALFANVGDASGENEVWFTNLKIAGDAGDADSIFGKASGTVNFDGIVINVPSLKIAAIVDQAEEDAQVVLYTIISYADAGVGAIVGDLLCYVDMWGVLVMADAPALNGTVATDSDFAVAYLDGVEYYDVNGIRYDDADTFASGKVAYEVNDDFNYYADSYVIPEFASTLLVQQIGADALPYQGRVLADGRNVVVAIVENDEIVGYKNAGFTYSDDVPALPDDEEEAELDYTALNKAIADAEALDASKYTNASWTTVKTFLAAAKSALTSNSQTAIDVAAASLNSAVSALAEKPADDGETVDYAALDAAIAKAEAYKASNYSEGTWATLQTMLAMAKKAKTAKTQNEVDQAVAALNSAIASLKAPVATDAPKDEPKPTEPAKDEGCGGLVGGAAVVLTAVVALGAGISFKKKED